MLFVRRLFQIERDNRKFKTEFGGRVQCDQIWRKFATFGTILKVLGKIVRVYLVFGKILIVLWQKCFIIWQTFIIVDGQILLNNFAIWSHSSRVGGMRMFPAECNLQ